MGARKSSKDVLQGTAGDLKESEEGSRRRWKELRPGAGSVDKVGKASPARGHAQDNEELTLKCVGLQQKLGSMRKQDSLLFL